MAPSVLSSLVARAKSSETDHRTRSPSLKTAALALEAAVRLSKGAESVAPFSTWVAPAALRFHDAVPRAFIVDRAGYAAAAAIPQLSRFGHLGGTMPAAAKLAARYPPTAFADALLRGASQVVFASNPLSGALILLGIGLADPRACAHGALALFAATAAAAALEIDAHQIQAGLFGYNGLLVGLALAAFLDGGEEAGGWDGAVLGLCVGLGALSSLLQLALGNALVPTFQSPPFTLAFNVTMLIAVLAAPQLSAVRRAPFLTPAFASEVADAVPAAPPRFEGAEGLAALGRALRAALVSLGQVFVVQSETAGALVLGAVALSSRIAACAAYGGALWGVTLASVLGAPAGQVGAGLWGYNACLGALAVVTFEYPTAGACSFGACAYASLCVLLDAALRTALAPLGAPVGTVPFCLSALAALLTHGKLNILYPVPIADVSTAEDHLLSLVTDTSVHAGASARKAVVLSREVYRAPSAAGGLRLPTRRAAAARDTAGGGERPTKPVTGEQAV